VSRQDGQVTLRSTMNCRPKGRVLQLLEALPPAPGEKKARVKWGCSVCNQTWTGLAPSARMRRPSCPRCGSWRVRVVNHLPDKKRWEAVRAAVFQRDGYRCRWCGKPTTHPVAHHLHYRDPYNRETMITLCAHCHWAHHHPIEALLETRWGQVIAVVLLLLAIGFLVLLFSGKQMGVGSHQIAFSRRPAKCAILALYGSGGRSRIFTPEPSEDEVLLVHPQEMGEAKIQGVGQAQLVGSRSAPQPTPGCAINPQREPGPMVGLGPTAGWQGADPLCPLEDPTNKFRERKPPPLRVLLEAFVDKGVDPDPPGGSPWIHLFEV